MPLFRKRPVVIEAQQFDGSNASTAAILYWIGQSETARAAAESGQRLAFVNGVGTLFIRTLESGDGHHIVDQGDWIIKGVAGEFYPCKPSIFAATYEPADPPGGPQGARGKEK
jgi:hypothetical protein